MDKAQYDKLVAECSEEAEGVLKNNFSSTDLQISVRNELVEEGQSEYQRNMFVDFGSGETPMSLRATMNILSMTGFSTRLFQELDIGQLSADLNYQMARYNNIGIIMVRDAAISIFDTTEHEYRAYTDLIPDPPNIAFVRGSPITADSITFQTREVDLDAGTEEHLMLGMNSVISSTSRIANRFRFGVFRVVCSNGIVSPMFMRQDVPDIDINLFRGIMNGFRENIGEFAENFIGFKNKMIVFNITREQLVEVLQYLSLAKTMKNICIACCERGEDVDAVMRAAGVERVSNLWEVFNVLTYLTNQIPNDKRSQHATRNVYDWADKILQMVNLN